MVKRKLKLSIILGMLGLLSLSTTACNKGEGLESSISSSTNNDSSSQDSSNIEPNEENILFRLYYYRDDGQALDFNNLWFWSNENDELGGGYNFFTGETKKFSQTGQMEWAEAIIVKGQSIQATSSWSIPDANYRTIIVSEECFSGGMIIRTPDGSRQTGEISVDFNQIKANGTKDVFFIDKGQKVNGELYYSVNDIPSFSVKKAYANVNSFGKPCIDFEVKDDLNFLIDDMRIRPYIYSSGKKVYLSDVSIKSNIRKVKDKVYRVDLDIGNKFDLTRKYELEIREGSGSSNYPIDMQMYYSSKNFEENFTPSLDYQLGSFIRTNVESGKEETVFRLWAPFSTECKLTYFANGDFSNYASKSMTKLDNGVFEIVLPGNLGGTYYRYNLVTYGQNKLYVCDPYAESSIVNKEQRNPDFSMVVDWNSELVDPGYDDNRFSSGSSEFGSWDDVKPSSVTQNKATVSELHVRDFSSDESWTGEKENVGKFKALTETGLTLENTQIKIGYDYVKDLANSGLTHIQLLPIYDYASVDETKLDDEEYINKPSKGIFNWGYDPKNYNSVEGSYSLNPSDGYTRIRELRSVIQAFGKANLGVVMDVVYNHMPSQNSTTFNNAVPDYYFRTQDVSGAGASMMTSRKMFSKFVTDSCKMWAKHYKMSGFRFDLMGIIDAQTMMNTAREVRKINPNALMYGEGWQMFSDAGDQGSSVMMASQRNLQYFGMPEYSGTGEIDERQFVGAFNDNYRDSLNGGTGNIDTKGFMQRAYDSANTSNTTERKKAYYGLLGTKPYDYQMFKEDGNPGFDAYSYSNVFTGSSINYTECHDNLTAYDKLYATMQNEQIAKDLSKLGNTITAMGLGTAFYQFGQEFGRSKEITDEKYLEDKEVMKSAYSVTFADGSTHYFSHNSYNTGDKVNSIKWDLVKDNNYMIDAFKDSIKARKEITNLQKLDDIKSVYYTGEDNFNLNDKQTRVNTINLMMKASDGKSIYFIANPQKTSITISIPFAGEAYVLAGDGMGNTVSGSITINPTSFAILKG